MASWRNHSDLEGYLQKHSPKGIVKLWKTRYFQQRKGVIYYYRKKGDVTPLGMIDCADITEIRWKRAAQQQQQQQHPQQQGLNDSSHEQNSNTTNSTPSDALQRKSVDGSEAGGDEGGKAFEIRTPTRVYTLATDSEEMARKWVDGLRHYIVDEERRKRTELDDYITGGQPQPQQQQHQAGDLPSLSVSVNSDSEDEDPQQKRASSAQGDGSVALRKSRKEEEKELGLLGGERVLTKQEGVLFSHHALHQGKWGHLWITNFRLIFAVKKKKNSVPLAVVVKLDQAKHEERHLLGFLLTCKDFRIISLFFLQPQAHKATQKIFKHFLFPTKLKNLFAFQNKEKYPLQSELSGWPLFSVQKEFKRQNLPTDEWRLAEVNKNYTMSTFPAQFIVPASISDESIAACLNSDIKWK